MLHNEKKGMEEQLASALKKLEDMERKYLMEQSSRIDTEKSLILIREEKMDMDKLVQKQGNEIMEMEATMLHLKANYEKENRLNESFKKQIDDLTSEVNNLSSISEETRALQTQWEAEREEMNDIIAVLTEERDNSCKHEEELFEELREVKADLEILQESYIDMTDRCNNYQDELSEVRERLEDLKGKTSSLYSSDSVGDNALYRMQRHFSDPTISVSASLPGHLGSCGVNTTADDNNQKIGTRANYDNEYADEFEEFE